MKRNRYKFVCEVCGSNYYAEEDVIFCEYFCSERKKTRLVEEQVVQNNLKEFGVDNE